MVNLNNSCKRAFFCVDRPFSHSFLSTLVNISSFSFFHWPGEAEKKCMSEGEDAELREEVKTVGAGPV